MSAGVEVNRPERGVASTVNRKTSAKSFTPSSGGTDGGTSSEKTQYSRNRCPGKASNRTRSSPSRTVTNLRPAAVIIVRRLVTDGTGNPSERARVALIRVYVEPVSKTKSGGRTNVPRAVSADSGSRNRRKRRIGPDGSGSANSTVNG
jgi:hypothetical protein